jgi:enediyne biosynthesis protein E4
VWRFFFGIFIVQLFFEKIKFSAGFSECVNLCILCEIKRSNFKPTFPFTPNKNPMRLLVFCLLFLTILSCKTTTNDSVFEKLDPSITNVNFVNQITETEEDNVLNYEYFYNGGGVASADFNNDGLTDLFFTGNQTPNKLYLNKGNLTFEDITEKAFPSEKNAKNWHTGVTVVDINNDGWQDLYVSVSANIDHPELRKNKLFINNKNLTGSTPRFTDKAAEYGLDLETYSTQSAFFDYDKDGDLDCYILNHNVKDFKRFDVEAVHFMRDSLAGHRLMRNEGSPTGSGGGFVDVSLKAGIKGNPIGFGLGINISDLNGDNWPDIYISNDYLEEDYLYINNQKGGFTDEIKTRTNHISYFSMGNDVADLNNDLLPDIISTDMLPEDNKRQKLLFGPDKYEAYLSMLKGGIHPSFMRNMFQLNNGDGSFSEIGQLAGISNTDWSWSVLAADYDNDGHKDLFFSNGYLRDYTDMDFQKYYADASIQSGVKVTDMIEKMPSTKTPNYIFRNKGDLTFENKQKDWGFDEPIISNGAVSVDLDNDGDLEIVTNNLNEPASIYKNLVTESGKTNFLNINLTINQKYGTKIFLYSGKNAQYQEFTPTHGYQSSNMSNLHFGLGESKMIDSLIVIWPDGGIEKLENIKANQVLKLENDMAHTPLVSKGVNIGTRFTQIKFDFYHQQMPLNDFARQLLLPQMYSYAGPKIAKADVNNDGLEDFYIGGGKGQAGQLFLQNKGGNFTPKNQPDFANDAICTDTDAVFFDIDSDGDQDLHVASGGYEYLPNDLALQNRVYLNDGKGNFTKTFDAFDDQPYADNTVKTIDFDKDGDMDLLVGGGCIPQQYPMFNPSRLYRNDKGKLTKVVNPVFDNLGLINDFAILDFNKDGFDDIVAVGEWTGVQFLENKKGKFEKLENGLEKMTGFWNRIQSIDIENDGDLDLVLGNFGLNSQYKASENEPINMNLADYDGNGTLDPIMSYYIQGKNYPAYSRDELLDQLAPLRKKFTNYELYSTAITDDILAEFKDKVPTKKEVNTLETIILVNNKGKFEKGTFPIQAQFAPVFAIAVEDLNNDGFKDIILAGNQSHSRVRIGNIDANFGQVFINNTKGGFNYLPQSQSGLQLKGDVKDLQIVGNQLVVGVNHGKIGRYLLKK